MEPRTEAGKAHVKEFGATFAVWPAQSFVASVVAIEDEAAEAGKASVVSRRAYVPCMSDLRCCRNDGHDGPHLYPDAA